METSANASQKTGNQSTKKAPRKYERKHPKKCAACGKTFYAKYKNARCCTAKCRHNLWDERRSLIAAEERIMKALTTLTEAIHDPLLAPLAYKLIAEAQLATREIVIEADQSAYGRQLSLFANTTIQAA